MTSSNMVTMNINVAILLLSFVVILPTNAVDDYALNSFNRFSFEFFKETSKLNPDKSIVVSPLSSQIVLGLLSTAAKGNTQKEIFDALHINDTDTIKSIFKNMLKELKDFYKDSLNIANKVYIKDGKSYELASEFKSIAKDSFSSDIENIDFSKTEQAAEIINNWVRKETKDKIKDLISSDSINEKSRAILINALNFHGKWETPFDKKETTKKPFYINNTKSILVDTMHIEEGLPMEYDNELKTMFLGLPYDTEGSFLVIALPDDASKLSILEDKIINYDFNDILRSRGVFYSINVEIPKFKIETSIDLVYIFKKLGIEQLFDENRADLSGLLKNDEKLYISDGIHKAFIDVNEEGTDASASTYARATYVTTATDFIANHPFLYFLINKGNIVFCGKYMGN